MKDLKFNSVLDFQKYCQSEIITNALKSAIDNGDRSFCFGSQYQSVTGVFDDLSSLRSPYYEAKRKQAILPLPEQQTNHSYQWADTGLFFDVSKAIEGQPECWLFQEPAEAKQLTIELNLGISASISGSEMFVKYQEVINLYNSLVLKGISVSLKFVSEGVAKTTKCGQQTYRVSFPIAGFGEYLDESLFVYFINPEFYRSFILTGIPNSIWGPCGAISWTTRHKELNAVVSRYNHSTKTLQIGGLMSGNDGNFSADTFQSKLTEFFQS